MKGLTFFCLILLNISVYAQYKAVYLPEDKLNAIKIDGKSEDWDWVPKAYTIDNTLMNDVDKGNKSNLDDWNCQIIVGWNDLTNRIYVLAKVYDDLLVSSNTAFYLNDGLQIALNPACLTGKYSNDGASSRKELYSNIIKGNFSVLDQGNRMRLEGIFRPEWAAESSDYFEYAYSSQKAENGMHLTIYEMSLTLWDEWVEEGPVFSKRSELYPNKIIGLTMSFVDADKSNNEREAEWVTLSTKGWYWDADQISQFKLSAPAEKRISYYLIKEILKP